MFPKFLIFNSLYSRVLRLQRRITKINRGYSSNATLHVASSLVHIRRTGFFSYNFLTVVSRSQIADKIAYIIKRARQPQDDNTSDVSAVLCPVENCSRLRTTLTRWQGNRLTNRTKAVRLSRNCQPIIERRVQLQKPVVGIPHYLLVFIVFTTKQNVQFPGD